MGLPAAGVRLRLWLRPGQGPDLEGCWLWMVGSGAPGPRIKARS